MDIFGRLDRLAIARKHVKMRGTRKGFGGGFDGVKSRLNKRPLAPTAFDPPPRKTTFGLSPSPSRIASNADGLALASKWIAI